MWPGRAVALRIGTLKPLVALPPVVLMDISRPLGAGTAPWPGDAPFHAERTATLGEGGSGANVCAFRTTTHLGTHVDAPWHVLADGPSVDALPLAPFVGPARVIDARRARSGGDALGAVVEPEEGVLRQLDGIRGMRALFRTGAPGPADGSRLGPGQRTFDPGFAGLAPGLAEELVRRGAVLCGTDAPSVDAFHAAHLPVHGILARGDCQVLEGLDLARAEPGEYELIALPLRLEGLDASPVRAVLRR